MTIHLFRIPNEDENGHLLIQAPEHIRPDDALLLINAVIKDVNTELGNDHTSSSSFLPSTIIARLTEMGFSSCEEQFVIHNTVYWDTDEEIDDDDQKLLDAFNARKKIDQVIQGAAAKKATP